MNLIVRGVNYNPSEETKEFLNKKIQKLDFAEEYLHDLELVMTRLTVGQGFHVDSHLHFVWGTHKAIGVDCYELYDGILASIEKIAKVARREKGKVTDNKGKEPLTKSELFEEDIDEELN
jgi:putative sigma-54 modulation protein